MKHSVIFENCENKWDSGLPIGNGSFGAMMYFENHNLAMTMNHYEVYYNIGKNVLPKDKLANTPPVPVPGQRKERFLEQVEKNLPNEGEPFCIYNFKRQNTFRCDITDISKFTSSYPQTGTLIYNFRKEVTENGFCLSLTAEDAKVHFSSGYDKLTMDTYALRKDCILNRIVQEDTSLTKSIGINFLPQRELTAPEITYHTIDSHTFCYTVKRLLDGEDPFVFSGIIRISGAKGELILAEHGAEIKLHDAQKEIDILTGIFTQFRYHDTLSQGIEAMDKYQNNISKLCEEHKLYWKNFFDGSRVSIPDKFLEHIYYINQYALDCSGGKDGIMKHHACGLCGLWDVRHVTLWGSMWYWDVNIQAAFAGVFSSGKLELAKVFSDGLMSYVPLAERFARDVHDMDGLAGDYPHHTYNCMWAWCAQYLWYLYEYTLDKEYLKKEAYPLFVKLCRFYSKVFKYNKEKGYYSIYPDVSPEQGPFAHDTVITVACVKYLFSFTLEAAQILNDDDEILTVCREILNNMPPYPKSKDGMWSVHIKDSEDAPDNLWIRHPSMLMPVFPIGEISGDSSNEDVRAFSNTIDYLEERLEIGIFGGSWLAAAAARLGRGQTALRILYERGIDHMLRPNGLAAEETDRFINHCLVPRQPLYYPCMMEFTGGMIAAVNEMLLQSHNGIVHVFPALPDGKADYGTFLRHGYSINEYPDRCSEYPKWNTVSFERLLAKGAFEISASLSDGVLDYITVLSKKGGTIRLTSPFLTSKPCIMCDGSKVKYTLENGIFTFVTHKGKSYTICEAQMCTTPISVKNHNPDIPSVITHETYTKRIISIGDNPESIYQKALDSFIRDWYVGNTRLTNHTVYKFDFSSKPDKNYNAELTRQAFVAEEKAHWALPYNIFPDGELGFTDFKGYGFRCADNITLTERSGPDLLRQDFAEGYEDAEFIIEAPRGQYELLVVSGDSDEDSVTVAEAINGRTAGGTIIKKGHYQCKLLPLVNEDDEPIRLKLSTIPGFKWKLNFLMLNQVKGY